MHSTSLNIQYLGHVYTNELVFYLKFKLTWVAGAYSPTLASLNHYSHCSASWPFLNSFPDMDDKVFLLVDLLININSNIY